jgi:hypothetical protein
MQQKNQVKLRRVKLVTPQPKRFEIRAAKAGLEAAAGRMGPDK